MSKAEAAAGVLWVGVTFYAIFAGADFGAGLWTLLAGPGEKNRRPRQLVDWAIGPVWEANHVWLIFVLVVFWTAFPEAFGSVFSTLFIPLSLAALGIVLRGAGFAFHKLAPRVRGQLAAEGMFAVASVLTPFFLGTVVGAIAAGRVPVGNAAGDAFTSWFNPLSLLIGAMFVATGAYLSAVFLVSEARRAGADDLVRYFRTRALVAAAVAGVFAVAGIFALRDDARFVYDGLTSDGLPLVILSAVCGLAAIAILVRGKERGARPLAIGAVAAVVWGWAVGQHPYLLPTSLTIDAAAAPSDTLTWLLIVFGAAVLLVLPALGLLYTLGQRSELEGRIRKPGRGVTEQEFRELFAQVSNWGAFPEHPERGALNHLTPELVVAAAELVRTGVTVSLSLPLDTSERIDNPEPADHHMTMLTDQDIGSGSVRFAKDYIGADYHNEGHSHIDAFSHVAYEGRFYNGEPDRMVTAAGASAGSIDVLRDGLVGRGVLLDVPRVRGVRWMEPGEHVFTEDLESAEREQGVRVEPGDIMLVRTGHARRRREMPPWDTRTAKAGLHPTAAAFLSERRVAALGSDSNNDTAPSTTEGIGFPIHVLALNAMGVHLLDYLQLDDLASRCETEQRWEFLFSSAPLRISRGTGSPLNPTAVF